MFLKLNELGDLMREGLKSALLLFLLIYGRGSSTNCTLVNMLVQSPQMSLPNFKNRQESMKSES